MLSWIVFKYSSYLDAEASALLLFPMAFYKALTFPSLIKILIRQFVYLPLIVVS
jgi:hypothetical protein